MGEHADEHAVTERLARVIAEGIRNAVSDALAVGVGDSLAAAAVVWALEIAFHGMASRLETVRQALLASGTPRDLAFLLGRQIDPAAQETYRIEQQVRYQRIRDAEAPRG